MIMVICLCITRENGSLRPSFTGKQSMRLTIRALLTTIGLFIMTAANAELQIETITEGSGQAAEAGNKVFVHYTGKLRTAASLTVR